MPDALLPPRFLFRFSVPCLYAEPATASRAPGPGLKLTEQHKLVAFAELDARPVFAEFRAGWHESGIALSVIVRGKKQTVVCDAMRLMESDGVHLWFDTRNTQSVHRATRFCHHFVLLPKGAGKRNEDPTFAQPTIHRARENANRAAPGQVSVQSKTLKDGYQIEAFLRAGALTGYEPVESPRLGFAYEVRDRELGFQTFGCPEGFPYDEDPSLWATLELVR